MNTKQLKAHIAAGGLDSVFGEGKCIVLRIRPEGAVRIS